MNKIFVNNIGDLAEAQRASFYRFLSLGISEELVNFPNPFPARGFFSTRETPIYCYPNLIKFQSPTNSINSCLQDDKTYTIKLYVSGYYSYFLELTPKEQREIKIQKKKNDLLLLAGKPEEVSLKKRERVHVVQDIFFGEIPLMTEEGTFIINGCERVVVSQIIRSPGVYFRKEFGTRRRTIYTATIISNKGLWTKLFLDEKPPKKKPKKWDPVSPNLGKDRIYMKQRLDPCGPDQDDNLLFVFDIIRYLGLTFQEVSDSLRYPLHLSNHQFTNELHDPFTLDPEKAFVTKDDPENAFAIKKLFSNQRSGCFSIGEIGRYKINKRLGLNLPKDITHLTAHDFLGIIDGLIELKYYDRISDDIDDIKNKQIRSIGDLLQNQLRVGFYRLQKSIYEVPEDLNTDEGLNLEFGQSTDSEWLIDPRPLTYTIKEFFKTSQLSQFMDQVNPLSEMTHKRRISVFGPNGLKRDHISTVIRDIHPSQYGRLCPIETPEGQNAGLVTSIAMYGRIGSLGSIETPYFLMEDAHVFSDKPPIFLNPDQESETNVGFADVSLDEEKNINSEYITVKENAFFSVKKTKEVNFITTSPLQIISLATSLIPFVEHNDANRALMGSNMQRQAVPLLYTQKPIVGTGLEPTAILDSGMVIKSYCQGIVEFSSAFSVIIKDCSDQTISYFLRKYYRSNQETSINQRPIVWAGEHVFSGQIIVDGPATNDGELSLGKNLTIAYMPWEGYNYEDAIVINERLVIEDCLTSVHIEEYETSLTFGPLGEEKLTNDLPQLTNYIQRHLDEDGIVKIGSYVKEHDILVGKITPCEEDSTPEARLMRALHGKKSPPCRDTSLRVSHGTEGRVIDIRVFSSLILTTSNPESLEDVLDEEFLEDTINPTSLELKDYIGTYSKSDVIDETPKSDNLAKDSKSKRFLKDSKLKKAKKDSKLDEKNKEILKNIGKEDLFAEEMDEEILKSISEEDLFSEEMEEDFFSEEIDEEVLKNLNGKAPSNDIDFTDPLFELPNGGKCDMIRIYIAQIRKIQVGDKLAGRHGNKGIISRILPRQDMPYLPDGTPVDIIFNPLGVPSRMNVGQVFECLLGLAGEKLGTRFKVSPFDEIYGKEASRVLVNQKLKEAAIKTNCSWIFNPCYPGKILLRDGRTGEYFDNPITVGKSYILKLIHLVEDKIHARATGPYSMITEQPLAGKSQKGGQRFGEMEVWALEAFGCSNTLQELLTIKSDDIDGRNDMYEAILVRKEVAKPTPSIPETFLALIRELNALGLDFSIKKFDSGFESTTDMKETEKDIFQDLETRLKLRALLARKKIEDFANPTITPEKDNRVTKEKLKEKNKIIERFRQVEGVEFEED